MIITDQKLKIYDRILATVSALAIIIGGFWTLFEFIDAKKQENVLIRRQIELSTFIDKKTVYYELVDAEGEIATCNSFDEVAIAQKHFLKLYIGRAHIIAKLDPAVNDQKFAFKNLLEKYLTDKPSIKPFEYFGSSILALVDSCRVKLKIDSVYMAPPKGP